MHIRSTTTISAIALSLALIATPVLAAESTGGNQGSADAAVSRDAPLSLPAAAPKPTPDVDLTTLSRGVFGMDEAAALDSVGTETLNRDGSVTETPASAGVRDILAQEMKGSNPDMSVGRFVTSPDDRTQITDSSGYPYRVIGWLYMTDQSGENAWTCSGTLIGPYTVLTAAHCVYDHESGGWVKSLTFLPGMTDDQTAPYGQVDWANINILKGFIDNYDGNYGSVMPWDLAVVELAEDTGNQLGWLGFRADDATDFKATLIGYPGDKPDGTMWETACDVPPENFGDQIFVHICDTYSGSSGASMYEQTDDYYVRGINVAENKEAELNIGVRLIDSYYQFIADHYK